MNTIVRTPPHNYEAEQALLGAILFDNRALEAVADFLQPEHFADPAHGRVYDACRRLIERGCVASFVTIKDKFLDDGQLEEIGGQRYLAELANCCVSVINAKDYGQIVYEMHLRRALIEAGQELVDRAYDFTADERPQEIQERHEASLFGIASDAFAGRVMSFGGAVRRALESADAARRARYEGRTIGITSGLLDLDRVIGGMRQSDLLILAGRPSMGKTALAQAIAINAAKSNHNVLFFSLEMSAEQLGCRGLSMESGVNSSKIERGETDNQEFEKVCLTGQKLDALPLEVDDSPAITPQRLRTRARRMKRQRGLDLIVVDYLQLMRLPEKTDNRVQEVTKITAALKGIAKELNVPILALSQLSRAVEQREDRRPQLSDLRDSGSIEQDADVVMFVYREQYYLEREEPSAGCDKYEDKYRKWCDRLAACRNTAEVIVAKQRRGAIGSAHLQFDSELVKFGNLAGGRQ